jgi:hypothetical protein
MPRDLRGFIEQQLEAKGQGITAPAFGFRNCRDLPNVKGNAVGRIIV